MKEIKEFLDGKRPYLFAHSIGVQSIEQVPYNIVTDGTVLKFEDTCEEVKAFRSKYDAVSYARMFINNNYTEKSTKEQAWEAIQFDLNKLRE